MLVRLPSKAMYECTDTSDGRDIAIYIFQSDGDIWYDEIDSLATKIVTYFFKSEL